MKRFFVFVLAAFVFLSCSSTAGSSSSSNGGSSGGSGSSASPIDVDGLEKLSSVDFAHNLKAGWNLGNTLDAYSDGGTMGLESETSWGLPRTTKEMVHAVKAAGFSSIRIPVSYRNHVDASLSVDSAWLLRVKEIVDWALDEDLFVIVNDHHDNLSESDAAAGNAGYCLSSDSALQEKSITYLTSIWRQVAELFKDYDLRLVFEIVNEPRRVGDSTEWSFSDASASKSWNAIITRCEKACLDVIRASGSNNQKRFVMCPEYAASPYYLDYYSLPSDSADDKLLLSVHAYDPYVFCMGSGSDNVFSSSVAGAITSLFAILSSKYTAKGIGAVMGETSASDKNNLSARVKWTAAYYSAANAAKVSVFLWDNNVTLSNGGDINSGECHGYFNRRALSWYFPSINAAIMAVYGN